MYRIANGDVDAEIFPMGPRIENPCGPKQDIA
jgi:hypothetical protein